MQILVTFCNNRLAGLAVIALFDPDSGDWRVVRLPDETGDVAGITGIAVSETRLFAAAQVPALRADRTTCTHSVLLVFDLATLQLLHRHSFMVTVDAHSMAWTGNALLVVSSGSDEITELTFSGAVIDAERVFWRAAPDGARQDSLHLNALLRSGAQVLVSGFGEKRGDDGVRDGFIIDVLTGTRIASGLDQPHALAERNHGNLIFCESRRRLVRAIDGSGVGDLPGYTRGLCTIGERLFVGTSIGRQISRSTGQFIENPAGLGESVGRCSISEISTDWQIQRTIDLSPCASEIYDLMPLPGAPAWPTLTDIEWRDRALARFSNALDCRNAELRTLRDQLRSK